MSSPPRSSRRAFLVSSAGVVAALAGARVARADRAATAPTVATFRSRADLKPPLLAVEAISPTAAPGHVFVAPFVGASTNHGTAMIVDDAGEPIWVYQSVHLVMNFRTQTYRGTPVLTWWEGVVVDGGYFAGMCVIADQSYRVVKRLSGPAGMQPEVHEFLITSRDTALVSFNNSVSADLSAYGGPNEGTIVEGVIREIDIASGATLFEWHSLDHVGVDETLLPVGATWDYFHLNSIDVDQDGNLLVSARHPCAVYKVDRSSGQVLWRLGGTKSDFALGPGATFWYQHDARSHPDGTLSLFDDGASTPQNAPEPESRALVLRLDTTAMTASAVASYPNPHGSSTFAMGNAQAMPGGGWLVGWGTVPEVTEFGPDGSVRFDATFPGGEWSYRAYRSPWSGRPAGAPAVAVVRNANGSVDVYASWNGATEVVRWRVLGGATPTSVRPLQTARRTGFETRVRLWHRPAQVRVEALDVAGKVLGTSRAVST
jgi:hypothetical protein